MKKVVVVLALMGMLSPAVLAATLVDDHFDDGALGTNTTGIGSGFNEFSGHDDSPVYESGSMATIENNAVGWARASFTSKDGADLGSAASFQFMGVSFAPGNSATWGGGGTARLALGVRGDSTAEDIDGGQAAGFWIQIMNDSLLSEGDGGAWNGTSVLMYQNTAGVATSLATWTFDTLYWGWDSEQLDAASDFSPALDIVLDLDTDGYALSISGDSTTLVSGAMSNTFADAGIVNELTSGYAFAFGQTEEPSMNTMIDQVVITGEAVIPEPATLALLGLGSLLLRRKK